MTAAYELHKLALKHIREEDSIQQARFRLGRTGRLRGATRSEIDKAWRELSKRCDRTLADKPRFEMGREHDRAPGIESNDEIVRLATKGWELGRIGNEPLDEATEKSVADFKLAMLQLNPADLMAALVVFEAVLAACRLTTERGFEATAQGAANDLTRPMEVLIAQVADGTKVIGAPMAATSWC